MTDKEKLILLEEMLELDEGSISADSSLSEIPAWDSMAILSFIVLVDEHFNKKADIAGIRQFKTVRDVLVFME